MSEPIKSDQTLQALRSDILNGSFVPGQQLRVAELSDRYGLSATPLREALSRLAGERLVVAETNRGWRVAPVSMAEFEDLAQARRVIETALLEDAMAQGGLEWESGIVAAHYRLSQTPAPLGDADTLENRQRWIAAHDAFHIALLAAARSGWLKGFYQQTIEQLQRHHQAVLFHSATPRSDGSAITGILSAALSVPRHTRMMEIVLSRDLAAARHELEVHIDQTLSIYRQIVDLQEKTTPPAERKKA